MPATNLIVFRDNGKEVPAANLLLEFGNAIDRIAHRSDSDAVIDALLLAGQLECALSDCGWPTSQTAEAITNWLAARMIGSQPAEHRIRRWRAQLENSPLPQRVRISPPEGFTYYALHPADFAEAVTCYSRKERVAVVGIRSIGTVLSAVAIAALKHLGTLAERITVRPTGHPYNRTLTFNDAQRSWVQQQRQNASHFLVVDEGPGLSGSSFLATAEALVRCGVNQNQLTLMGTRDLDPQQLCAQNAANRWAQFHWQKVPSRLCREFADFTFLGGGSWRSRLFPSRLQFPPCWPEMERLKFLSADRTRLFKFEGFGQSGAEARQRAAALSRAGFGPHRENIGSGMSAYQVVDGCPFNPVVCTQAILEHVANYCAFRVSEFKTHSADGNKLEEMTKFNFAQEFGRDPIVPPGSLESQHAVIVDGRMQPHEWIASKDGKLQKADAATHGDDHFMPGPTDIAWDLAGTVVEWNLDADAEAFLLNRFQSLTGIDTRRRFHDFLLAYALFRLSYCRMAASGTAIADEQLRLGRACEFYRRRITATAVA